MGSTLIDVKIFIWIMSPLWSKRQVSYNSSQKISISECIALFQRVRCAEILRKEVPFKSQNLISSFCKCVRTMIKYVTSVIGKLNFVFFQFDFRCFPPRPEMPILCCVCMRRQFIDQMVSLVKGGGNFFRLEVPISIINSFVRPCRPIRAFNVL